MEFEIQLTSVKDVQEFVALATSKPFPVTVGNARHRVNGKSFMEMFCLNLRKPVTVTFLCSDEEYDLFCRETAEFAVL